MDFLDIAEYELKFQRHLLRQFDKLRKIKDDGQLFCKKNKKGYRAYYIKDKTGGGDITSKNPERSFIVSTGFRQKAWALLQLNGLKIILNF